VARQCELLKVNRSSLYYKSKAESPLNIRLKEMIKEKYKEYPFYGVPRMYQWLRKDMGYDINKKRVERLYKELNLHAVMPKRNLSKANKEHKKYPYLLNDIEIKKVNQVWQTDITYIPMRKGFMYLTAVIDVYSRMVVSWSVSNTMSSKWCKSVMKQAVEKHGKPEIVNTDQGSQYTSEDFIGYLEDNKIKISMDSKGRATDNIYIERLWRSVKYEDLYLRSYENGLELYYGIKKYFKFYNTERRHRNLDYSTPAEVFFSFKLPQFLTRAVQKKKIISNFENVV
jgi:putative transposase